MITFNNLITIFTFSYGIVVIKECLLAYRKAVTEDFMWYTCHIFEVPWSLKTALVIRILLLITGGWALVSSYQDVIDICCSR